MKKYFLFILIVIQPFLDILAFWTASDNGTVAGYIRLATLLAVMLLLGIRHYKDRRLYIVAAVCLLVFGGHILNALRLGYISFSRDLSYIVRVVFMPIVALFYALETDDENLSSQILKGIAINTFVVVDVILISYLTGTYTYTYGEGLGISGWVTMDNRCCHSDILSGLCIFLSYFALRSDRKWASVLLPLGVFVLLYTNGTRACYVTLVAIGACYLLYILAKRLLLREKLTKPRIYFCVSLLVVLLASMVLYPYSPRAAEEEYKRSHFSTVEREFVEKMEGLGYDIYNMTLEEKMADPVVHEELRTYYNAFCWGGIPQIVQRFDLDTIIYKYGGTIDSGTLGNTRTMKQMYASLIMDTQDFLTHMFGYEIAQLGDDMVVDMENDYYAILYYYGYVGFFAYILGFGYLLYRVLRKVISDFSLAMTDLNFTLLFVFAIQLGLAYFSGAMLRRPNASIYLCIVIGMLYHETKCHTSRV